MKAKIHPKYYEKTKIVCACGATYEFGAATEDIQVEVCAACHPFYTGQMKYVDSAGRVDAFKSRRANAIKKILSKSERRRIKRQKRISDMMNRPDTLDDIRKVVNKASKKKSKKKSK